MNEQERLQALRAIFQDCQQQVLTLLNHHPTLNKGFVADMQFASTYGTFLANIKMNHGVELEEDSIAQRLLSAIQANDTHQISQIRSEIYASLDSMQTEQMPSYVFLTCFPSIYKAIPANH